MERPTSASPVSLSALSRNSKSEGDQSSESAARIGAEPMLEVSPRSLRAEGSDQRKSYFAQPQSRAAFRRSHTAVTSTLNTRLQKL
jgi:hypothetical protein